MVAGATGKGARFPARALSIAILALFPAGGCEEDSAEVAVVKAWQNAGLTAPEFTSRKEALGDGTCWSGSVAGMDTVLCQYKDRPTARAARKAGLAFVGNTTGVAIDAGVWLLAVSDRKGADPSGKTINQISKIFLDTVPATRTGKTEPAGKGGKKAAGKKAAGKNDP